MVPIPSPTQVPHPGPTPYPTLKPTLYPTVAPTSPTLVKIVLTMGIRLTSSTVDTESAIKQTLALILSLEPSDFKDYRMRWDTSLF
jgi:hypothetical protein